MIDRPDGLGRGITLKRIYEDPSSDGHRVLVDRLWPRGVSKEVADLDEWLKDVAPSTELRRWYDHQPSRFAEFARRYQIELGRPPASGAITHLLDLSKRGEVVLLTATRDLDHSGARVLLDHLNEMQQR